MIFMQMELVWDKKKQRLVLQQLIEQMEKTSTFFASFRKKKLLEKIFIILILIQNTIQNLILVLVLLLVLILYDQISYWIQGLVLILG